MNDSLVPYNSSADRTTYLTSSKALAFMSCTSGLARISKRANYITYTSDHALVAKMNYKVPRRYLMTSSCIMKCN